MSDYAVLVNARNRVLAADPSPEKHVTYHFLQNAIDQFDSADAAELVRCAVVLAKWYVNYPQTGEG